jgi:glycosyltransferase involved in cell wall biosynthesis
MASAARDTVRASLAPLRIGIDAHTVGNRRSGDESYTVGLVRGLSRIDARNLYTLYTTSDAAPDILGPLPENFSVRRVRPHQRHTRIMLSLPLWLARDRQDVAHFQYIAPPRLSASLVLTVHDVSFEVFPEYFAPMERLALRRGTPFNMRRADKVVTGSDFSKQQLTEIYGLPPDKIAVTHYAVGDDFSAAACTATGQEVRRRLGLDRDFILWVGNFIRRKRPDVLVEAFRRLVSEDDAGCDLVLAGAKTGMYPEVLDAVRRAGLEQRVRFLGYVAAEDLPQLYRQARVFVFPSEYEGFGLPVLEAMSCGAPVICSSGSSLAEVVGDAAIALPRVTVESLTTALRAVLHDESRRRELTHRGLARAKCFSWDETARSTLQVYEEAFLAYTGRAAGRRH